MEKQWYLYILKCEDNFFYTGISPDVKRRVLAHKSGKGARFTKLHPPTELVYIEAVGGISNALKTERSYKRLSRKKKEDIVDAFQQKLPKMRNKTLLEFLSVNNE